MGSNGTNRLDDYRFDGSSKFKIAKLDASAKPFSTGSKSDDNARLAEVAARLDALQDTLYAEHRRKVLVILQGMDTSGKDGTVRGVFRAMDPLGLRVVGFKAPTPQELAHDYLWRVHAQTPARGEIVIFNRSHYEDVLITRVHGDIDAAECKRRYGHINAFEQMLVDTGTTIVKCFLHISKDEQRKRLQERIDDPHKHWKFDPADMEERKLWDGYMEAYGAAINATATPHAPWYVIPADSKTHRNLMVAEILLEVFEGMKPQYPEGNPAFEALRIE
ncbi:MULTISPECIES: polyphosphate kinase 2 family protein [Ralstonia]|uniref:Polyphosphate:nucleotide phosphotransferase, PPK2 family n=2 Tax=Pseudomonadota TaxID=1224 RepID=A0AAJ5D3G9_9RALS|nr:MULTISPECIES: polyphosphate kinase 2 family protein [Ralstonia]AJW43907.1 polyphosphate kinase [Ralstonia mannitolilytica]MBU9579961.1 polyphosphate kinase 2 family protein [Ralstonia mannitolilytica]PLT16478.1 polyphosphate kinase 2 family protein [Ralstonia mannitolilytica]QIF06279.1 polyphosphate kinase 2 family protein [Ralstonia mannitolilytica]CAG2146848.1 Polyphosphate:AMP/ADP phosphotransferase [Ralstonia mannitolilytica]